MSEALDKHEIAEHFRRLQDDICSKLEAYDQKGIFREDHWQRPGGGGGRTRILENANILEKGGVNFSAVHGSLPEKIRTALQLEPDNFFATGVSIVMHPFNPWVPIIHMNVRYFELDGGGWWFGGGIDLTPHYVIPRDASWFHQQLQAVCDRHHPSYYSHFKRWADDYFFIPHRKETRGVGGIFFDRLNESEGFSKEDRFAFASAVGASFFPIYAELMDRNKDRSQGREAKSWQAHRRGRYVEFNLVYDKGTKFGLETDGRIESILMSLPPQAQWSYLHDAVDDQHAVATQDWLRKGIDWVAGVPEPTDSR